MLKKQAPQTWVEVSQSALKENVRELRKQLSSKAAFMAVVKANAYGHGLPEVISILKNEKVDWFGVFSANDAFTIREQTKKPILVLCAQEQSAWTKAHKQNISVTIATFDELKALKVFKQKRGLKIHLKVDTGLGRQGFLVSDMPKVLAYITELKLTIEGLYTHFAGTENNIFDAYTKKQYSELMKWKSVLNERGLNPLIHAGATSGVIRHNDTVCDIARFGIGVYGLWPSPETKLSDKKRTKLTPVLSWRTTIVQVKLLKKGTPIAYDCTYILKRDSKVAIIPVGYYDGLDRQLSNKGFVLIGGRRVPLIGRVMMNMCIVDVTDVPRVKVGDMVTLIGADGRNYISAEEVALLSQTIQYEVVTRINPLLPRLITR